MTLDEYIKEQRERVANMTLAQARQIVANHYGHDDMRIECEKAVWMLLNCADEKINGGWIPVIEKLPEEKTAVLLSCDDMYLAKLNPCIGWISGNNWYTFSARGSYLVKYPIAWMPLPEPYRAEREVEEWRGNVKNVQSGNILKGMDMGVSMDKL